METIPKPLLILGDAPSAPTGLGHIACDLAVRINENMKDTFRVATVGCGGTYSSHLHFPQYTVPVRPGYVIPELPQIWDDFAEGEKGYLLAIWNPGWLDWLADYETLPECDLRNFLKDEPFEKWLYCPVDGDCNGILPYSITKTLAGFDRVLPYTQYGADVIRRSTATGCSDPLPHGIDDQIYYPRDKAAARREFLKHVGKIDAPITEDIFLIGIVATNTPRKDWYLAFETCAELLGDGINVALWAHTDAVKKYWDLIELADQFGMMGRLVVSTLNLQPQVMAWCYAACDVTLGIGSGEGWGFPIAESLAQGIPVVHGDYAGGAELLPMHMKVKPIGFRGEGVYGIRRPVYNASDWANAVMAVTRIRTGGRSLLPDYINWTTAWPKWQEWLQAGVK